MTMCQDKASRLLNAKTRSRISWERDTSIKTKQLSNSRNSIKTHKGRANSMKLVLVVFNGCTQLGPFSLIEHCVPIVVRLFIYISKAPSSVKCKKG